MPNNPYETTYGTSMAHKQLLANNRKENTNFKCSVNITGEGKTDFQTESRAKYN
jgi:hypothetical protein